MTAPPERAASGDGRPPFGSWPRTYGLVLLVAAVVILLLHWLTAAWDRGPIR